MLGYPLYIFLQLRNILKDDVVDLLKYIIISPGPGSPDEPGLMNMAAAKRLSIGYNTLWRKIKEYGLERA